MAKLNYSYEVLGFRRIEYVKKSTGDRVQGYEVYMSPTETAEDTVGLEVDKVFLSDKYACFKPKLGLIVRKSYNRFGSVEDLIVCG